QRRRGQAEEAVAAASALAKGAEAELGGITETLRASGGDRLDRARGALREVDTRFDEVERARHRLEKSLATLGATVSDGDDFAALVTQAHRLLGDQKARQTAQNHFAEAKTQQTSVTREL